MNEARDILKKKQKIVIKIGTSSLSYPNGRLNFKRIEKLTNTIAELQNMGKRITLVSSGAIGVGAGRLGMTKKPDELSLKQALASVGQAELIKIYQKFFENKNQICAQVLLTKDIMVDGEKNCNANNTLHRLMEMNIIPIINENDTISVDEIVFGDNDTLSAHVAQLIHADLLIMLSDIDGLYSADPNKNKDAQIISEVNEIDENIERISSGSGNNFGTGGMITKIIAAKQMMEKSIDVVIMNGTAPEKMMQLLEGESIGTLFSARKVNHI